MLKWVVGFGGAIQPAQALSLGTLQVTAITSGGIPTHVPSFAAELQWGGGGGVREADEKRETRGQPEPFLPPASSQGAWMEQSYSGQE